MASLINVNGENLQCEFEKKKREVVWEVTLYAEYACLYSD